MCRQLGVPAATVGIPEHRAQPGPRTPQEWTLLQQAPSIGERITRVDAGVDAINNSLGCLEQLYPDRTGDACSINATGS
jgi:hypothetical protein